MRSALILLGVGLGFVSLAIAANEAFAARDVRSEGMYPKTAKLSCWPFGVRGRRLLVCREQSIR